MPRPRLPRRINFEPCSTYFKPQGIPMSSLEVEELSHEEIEAFRLRHYKDLDQKESAKKMSISVSTYQRILYEVNKKIARALVEGRAIKIVK